MHYQLAHQTLQALFNLEADRMPIAGTQVDIHTYAFESTAWPLLLGAEQYYCDTHQLAFAPKPDRPGHPIPKVLTVLDGEVWENRHFRYAVFADRRYPKAKGAILLCHGLNERDWVKYLPWALRLTETTGKAVVLFPIAFHMNRAPATWSSPRLMRKVVADRYKKSATITNATFANAAISTRLEAAPERFVWSGLQTLRDIRSFVNRLKTGEHPLFEARASVDLFAYSIGALLAQILLLANNDDGFENAKAFLFCGGATLDRMYPNSRYIMDSDASIALYAFFTARFENELRADERLAHYLGIDHAEGWAFRTMLNSREQRKTRENRFRELGPRLAAFALQQDEVVPAIEIVNTLQGNVREIPIKVTVDDFSYPYNHVIPFPTHVAEDDVDKAFDRVFEAAAKHLS